MADQRPWHPTWDSWDDWDIEDLYSKARTIYGLKECSVNLTFTVREISDQDAEARNASTSLSQGIEF